uniref:RING-type E3 ubiquitin transferase n=1 Tax=Eptatretus burgeri TaxID=7764 RepID=A0A8C4R558_EPTBU
MPRRRSALGLGADVKGCGCCGRCRLFFGDLKALLLKRPASAASDPGTADGEDDAAQAAVATAAALLAATTSLATMVAASEASGAAEESVLCGQGADAESLASGNTGTRTPLCRICFQGPEKEELLNPCRCNGSVRWTHQPCLLTWISERGSWSCELCYYKYHVRPVSTKHPAQVLKPSSFYSLHAAPLEAILTVCYR